MKKLSQVVWGLSLAIGLGTVNVQVQAAQLEHPDISMAVGKINGFFFLPGTVAYYLGYYKAEGLNVHMIDLGTGGKALQAMIGGSADIVNGSYEHTIQLTAKHIPLQAFVLQAQRGDYALGIVKGKIPNYRSLKDLKGKKIGISSPGSGSYMFTKLQLTKAGVNPDDVSWVSVGQGAGAVAAAEKGEVAAVANTDPVMVVLEKKKDVKIVADARTPAGSKAAFGSPYYPASSFFARTEFIKKYPNTIQALTNAMVRTLKWMHTHTPDQIMAVLPKDLVGSDPRTFKMALAKLLPTYSPDGLFPPGGAEAVKRGLSTFDPNVRNASFPLS
jgi:NitT/TauT family transport system substrate-binding protein